MATKVKAIFTGQDGSCGYKHGKEYSLVLNHTEGGRGKIEIAPFDDEAGFCSYNSINAFMRNWNNVQNI
jgi:hypothetical protein